MNLIWLSYTKDISVRWSLVTFPINILLLYLTDSALYISAAFHFKGRYGRKLPTLPKPYTYHKKKKNKNPRWVYFSHDLFRNIVYLQDRRGSKGQLPSRLLCHQLKSPYQDSRRRDCTSVYSFRRAVGQLASIRCCLEPGCSLQYDRSSGPSSQMHSGSWSPWQEQRSKGGVSGGHGAAGSRVQGSPVGLWMLREEECLWAVWENGRSQRDAVSHASPAFSEIAGFVSGS